MKHLLICACAVASWSGGPFSPILQVHSLEEARTYLQAFAYPDGEAEAVGAEASLPPLEAPLLQAHAHNDYEHRLPLFEALSHGFRSIEVDVHLIGDELYVSHAYPLVPDKDRTLKSLYLEPLKKWVALHGGRVFPDSNVPLMLMVDVKSEALATYEALKRQLAPYTDFLSTVENGTRTERAVQVYISGNRPVRAMANEAFRLADLDGRIEDLGKGYPADLMPVVSESFLHVFGVEWPGTGPSGEQWQVFKRLCRLVHAEGKEMRLWATPEQEQIWVLLLDNGADFISTDYLERLRFFLSNREGGSSAADSAALLPAHTTK